MALGGGIENDTGASFLNTAGLMIVLNRTQGGLGGFGGIGGSGTGGAAGAGGPSQTLISFGLGGPGEGGNGGAGRERRDHRWWRPFQRQPGNPCVQGSRRRQDPRGERLLRK